MTNFGLLIDYIMSNLIRGSRKFALLLKQEYDSGLSIAYLDKKYNTDCYYHFKKFNIPKRTHKENLLVKERLRIGRYKLNWTCDSITNETEAYIIGFMLSAGWNGKQAGFRLKEDDKYMVERIKNYFSEEIHLKSEGKSFGFVISSNIVCRNLEKLGVVRNKTYKELSIPCMPQNLLRHFIRGYFDGDGCIFVCNNKNNGFLKGNICSSTINILNEIQKILVDNNIECTINKELRKGKIMKVPNGEALCKNDMYRLFFRKKESILNLFHYMYDDSNIYLKRKFDKFNDNLDMLIYKRHANTELTEL